MKLRAHGTNLAQLRKLDIRYEIYGHFENLNHRFISGTLLGLNESNLNLKEFQIHLPQIIGADVSLLAEFLQSQHNLVRSGLLIESNDIRIMNELRTLIENCDSLKVLSLTIDNMNAQPLDYSAPTHTWNLNNVEHYVIIYEIILDVNDTVSPVLTAEIFQAKGDLMR